MAFELDTPRLRLVPLPLSTLRLRLSDYRAMETSLGLEPTSAPLYGDEAYDNGVGWGIANAVARMEQDEASYLWHTFWQIVLKVESRTIGEFDFHHAPGQDGVVAFGYMLCPWFRNRGYVTEAARG